MALLVILLITMSPLVWPASGSSGVITTLPDVSLKSQDDKGVVDGHGHNRELHTWSQKVGGGKEGPEQFFKLQCLLTPTAGEFTVKLYHGDKLVETVQASRFDGELTKSVTIVSATSSQHVVRYLMRKRRCVERTYTTDLQGNVAKKDTTCEVSFSIVQVATMKARKNWWHWSDQSIATSKTWTQLVPGYYGAVAEVPVINSRPETALKDAETVHTWINVKEGYFLDLRRVMEDNKPQYYVDIRYNKQVLERDIKVTRFDDNMLDSVSVWDLDPLHTLHQVQYKMKEGSCIDRTYTLVAAAKKGDPPTFQIQQSTCQYYTVFKLMNHAKNLDAFNGWLWSK